MLKKKIFSYPFKSASYKKIADFINKNHPLAASLAAAELAREVGVSDATVIRFAQKLGFSGFTELKEYLRAEMRGQAPHLAFALANKPVVNGHQQIENMSNLDSQNLQSVYQSFGGNKLDAAVKMLLKARTIYFIALGSSAILQDLLALHLHHLGLNIICIAENNAPNPERMVHMAAGDLLVAISFPRYSLRTCSIIKYAQKQGTDVLTITDAEDSPLAEPPNTALIVKTYSNSFFNSYVAPIALCNLLLMKIYLQDKESMQKRLEAHMSCLDTIKLYNRF